MKSPDSQLSDDLIKAKIPIAKSGIEIKKTICSICNPLTHCGIDAYVRDGKVIKVEGSLSNPHNEGTLCCKGAASRQYIYHPDRIKTPLRKKGGGKSGLYEAIDWDCALDEIAESLNKIKAESGPEGVVFFSGFSKWMRPFLQRLAHLFGTPNYCSESSTCFFATLIANILTYGDMGGPDLEHAKCVMMWSANPLHSETPDARHLMDAKENGMKIIEIGPLLTPLSRFADLHLRLRPGTDGALALGMAHVIIQENLYDQAFISRWTHGFDEFKAYAMEFTPDVVAQITDVPADLVTKAARLYATAKPAAMYNGASATVHHTNGVQNHRAIVALIGLTGNFDRKGGNHVVSPSYYHVPTGLVTREDEFEHPCSWDGMAPRAGQDRFPIWNSIVNESQAMHIPSQIDTGVPYPIRAMVAFGLNYRMWPGSDHMRESLKKLDFLVDVDLFLTDSAKLADIILPAASSFERSELKIWPERYAMWTRPVIAPVGQSRSDIDIICDLAGRLNLDDPLLSSGHEACMDWIMAPIGLKMEDLKASPQGRFIENQPETPYLKYERDGFPTPTGKMEFASSLLAEAGLEPLPKYVEPEISPVTTPGIADKYPLVLTTGSRIPMFIHSRTFRLPWTRKLRPDPKVDLNPLDARERQINHNDWVQLETPKASINVRANVTEITPPGVVNMYHAYPEADVNLLMESDYLDPISGYPGFKSLLCQIVKSEKNDKESA
jgi:anaerobic selenocysteine-containing dehydrogenase